VPGLRERDFYDERCAAMHKAGVESTAMLDAPRDWVGEAALGARQPA
jgi:hypothetical protein